ncbi:Ferredoxin--NADP(+) reductase [Candidatus Nasuia deltocephalinicola]|uniref:ferredoxin--NADP(+) reductase n=1 Tax=Candidatus Nasuia deltocephalincola TaxID=1160784 RepID=A0A7G6UHW3_9PROT|nr:Ferredoxin--NADP(+) reductase [Candidatus Nasuia deltocephalinicola]
MEKYNLEKIKSVHHWNESLFSFKCTRKNNFKFKNGEFVLLSLIDKEKKIIYRAYSILSSNYDNYLEFLSIKIENGIFTNILKNLTVGDNIYISKKPSGTLIFENLLNKGENLWFLSTGTGLSPFLSIIKNYEIYKNYSTVVLIHCVNYKSNLSYRYYINNIFYKNIINFNKLNFIYYPIVTKEKFINNKRITEIIKNKKIFIDTNLENFSKFKDRIMICGNMNMLIDIKNILQSLYNFYEFSSNQMGLFATEKAFIES